MTHRAREPLDDPQAVNEMRLREMHAQLMPLGYHRVEDIAAGRGEPTETTRQWLEDAERSDRLFSVEIEGERVVPASLLDDEFHEIPQWQAVLEVLHKFRRPGWPRWTWIDLPNAWLDGGVPSALIRSDPPQVLRAAQRKLESLQT